MLELADRQDSGSCVIRHVGVQVPFPAPLQAAPKGAVFFVLENPRLDRGFRLALAMRT